MNNNMNTIEVVLRKYKGMTFIDTYAWGYRLEVQTEIVPRQMPDGKWIINYDMRKAGMLIKKANDGNYYNFLCIKK